MKMIKNESEVQSFIEKYQNPSIITVTTMRDGFVTCIKPIKSICGAELHCSQNTKPTLQELIRKR